MHFCQPRTDNENAASPEGRAAEFPLPLALAKLWSCPSRTPHQADPPAGGNRDVEMLEERLVLPGLAEGHILEADLVRLDPDWPRVSMISHAQRLLCSCTNSSISLIERWN